MKIHEYQAKEVFRNHHIPVPEGYVAKTPDEARAAAEKLGALPVVVKAQIHAGGRGKGGGVKLARTLDDVRSAAAAILGRPLVTPQTGPEGKKHPLFFFNNRQALQPVQKPAWNGCVPVRGLPRHDLPQWQYQGKCSCFFKDMLPI